MTATSTPGAGPYTPDATPYVRPHHDQPARDRIRTDLATNMLVEAGAGSGKTTMLVERMLEHVRTGTPVERLTAVTFTRKAANELRERFQLRLERAAREAGGERPLYERALRELHRAFLGTIHSFCARLLRERPLEVGLDPGFAEVSEEEWEELKQRFWRKWVERAKRADDADLLALQAVGIEPGQLYEGFETVMLYPDVEFPVGDAPLPDVAACRAALERLMAAARQAMPVAEPEDGWDELMRLVRRLEFRRAVGDWTEVASFCEAIDGIAASHVKVVQKRWSESKEGKAAAKALSESWAALLDGEIADLLRRWREHRYPIVMRFLRRASEAFAAERHATGQLGFEDLLLLTARLLRENDEARDELGARHAHLLVDEFQDTDPIQAEVCFLLASPSSEGPDWRTVTPRPGALFVVGDPKQSIYRFRRADIQVYELVKRRLGETGAVLALTANFRSVSSIEAVVNAHFSTVFPEVATAEQAAYAPMQTVKDPVDADGVYRYVVRPEGKRKEDIIALDAAMVASWIASRVASGEKKPGDFMILTATKAPLASYARELARRNVPVATTGARLPQERELSELLVVLSALADPGNPVLVVAALEGVFFGCSPADLYAASSRGIRFSIARAPDDEGGVVGRGLSRLHAWWVASRSCPADVLLERMLDETGLLFYAASQELGEGRAGALLHLVEVLRASPVALGLGEVMERIGVLLESEASDAPLRPGRSDTVRVMNLHKAKGLEADVVVLAGPVDHEVREPMVHISRSASGQAVGALCLGERAGRAVRVLAQAPSWGESQAIEGRFAEAERERLLYVAGTRAGRELVVGQAEVALARGVKADEATWREMEAVLSEHALLVSLSAMPSVGSESISPTGTPSASMRKATGRAGEASSDSLTETGPDQLALL